MRAPQYLDRVAAARYLTERGISVQAGTLARWASNGRYDLPIIKLGRIVRYDRTDLDALIERSKITPGTAA